MTSATSLAAAEETRGATAGRLPRGSRASAFWTLYTLTLRQHAHGRRWLVMGLLFLLPVGLAILVRSTAPDVPAIGLEFVLAHMFVPQALLPIVALLYASGLVEDEQEEQTITYLVSRPIPRWAIYSLKLLATLTTTVMIAAVFTGLTYAAIYIGADARGENVPLRCLTSASIHALALVAYCSLFGLMSLLTRRILVVGVLYTAIVEGLLANLPFGIRLVTVIYYARLITYRTMEFLVPLPRDRTENIAADAWQFDVASDPQLAEHPQLATCVAVLVVGSVVCTMLAAWLCAGREFHVKTPEKD